MAVPVKTYDLAPGDYIHMPTGEGIDVVTGTFPQGGAYWRINVRRYWFDQTRPQGRDTFFFAGEQALHNCGED